MIGVKVVSRVDQFEPSSTLIMIVQVAGPVVERVKSHANDISV
jgi:hypothetical protein